MSGTVWLVTFDDTDFYCEGEHLVGVYATEALADAAIAAHTDRGGYRAPSGYEYNKDEHKIISDPTQVIIAEGRQLPWP